MHITMVKKRLSNGDPCEKCAQTEEMLRRRGLWDRIDEVVWALEGDPESAGNRLGARVGVAVAPFFVLRGDDGTETVFTSPLKMIREHFSQKKPTTDEKPVPGAAVPSDRPDGSQGLAELRARLADQAPHEILRFALERWGDRCKLGFSGAEEIVLIDMATRLDLPFRVFTLDTGRLHGETYAYLDDIRRRYGISIEVFLPDGAALGDFVRRKGVNSFYQEGHRACCALRKVAPLSRALDGCEAWVTGRRRDQNPSTRGDMPVVEADLRHIGPNGPLVTVNPLAAWSHDQVWDYIERNEVPHNPLHDQGYVSIGCEPCTRPVAPDQHSRSGRWWWETAGDRESGLHFAGDGI